MKSTPECHDDRLRWLLQMDEQCDGYQAAVRHVDDCLQCQQRIGELAAEHEEWQEAHAMLLAVDESALDGMDALSQRAERRRCWQSRPAPWTDAIARKLLAPPSHPEMMGRIGRYEVERLIGTGGMGIVFKAFDSELNRPVAIKLLTPYLAGSAAARKRFAREARAAAAVVHEHVVAIHNVETDGEIPFLVMQYIPGESLQSRLEREGPLGLCETLRIGMQIAAGLAAAHAQGLVHRDIKPANVLLEKGIERSLLTDFGLARAGDDVGLTATGHHPGTPQYMSPEQARGEALDGRSDLFSLGCVLYEMATGVSPFRSKSTLATLRRIVDEQPQAMASLVPELPPWFCHLVSRLLAKDPTQRFSSASEVSQVLEQCLSHLQQPSTVALPKSLMRIKPLSLGRRSISGFRGTLVMATLLILGLLTLFVGQRDTPSNASDAALEGVWEVVLPPDVAAQQPVEQRVRMVIVGNWQGTYRGDQRVSASRLTLEPHTTPKQLSFVGLEGQKMRGIYEVNADGLRLNVAPDAAAMPTKFATEHAEFQRVTDDLATQQLTELKRYSTLNRVSPDFRAQTTVLNGLVSGGGIIERIEGDTVHFTSGDRIQVPAATQLLLPVTGDGQREVVKASSLEPQMAIAYSLRDGKVERLVLVGILEQALLSKSAFETIKELGLRKGNEMTTSIDGRFPVRIQGSEGEVAVEVGETKLIQLPESTESIEWRAGDYTPEGIEDFEPFDYVLVQWRDNGHIAFTCYASPPRAR